MRTTPFRTIGPVALLALTAIIFWWPCLAGGKVPVAAVYQQQMPPFGAPSANPPRAWDALLWDSMAEFYPWRVLLQRGLRSGELPLWNPYQYCGYPFVGNGQSAIFYPPNWLLLFIDAKYFLGLSLALHWFLAGALTFFLARAVGLRPAGAVLAGLIYQTSGFMIAWCELPTVVNTMTWLPGAWLGVELLFRSGWHRRLAGVPRGADRRPPRTGETPVPPGTQAWKPVLPAGLALLALSLGLSLLAGHLQFAAYVWLTTALYALARTAYRWARRRPAPVAALALAVMLGLGIGLPQVLPSLELGRYSPRGETQVSAAGWKFLQQRALQPIELLTFASPEALGDPVTVSFPFSYTEHCAYAGVLALLLAVLGVALRRDRWAAFFGLGAVAAVSVALAGPLARLLYYGVPLLGQAGSFARILGVYTLCLAVLAGMGLEALLAAVARRQPATPFPGAHPAVLTAVALVIVAAELFPWGWRFLPLAPADQVYPETALTRLLEEKGKDPNYRVLCITPRENWSLVHVPYALLPPNAATVYGWYSPDGYDSLYLKTYRDWAAKTEEPDVAPLANGNMMLLNNVEEPSPLVEMIGLKWIASVEPLNPAYSDLKRQEGGIYLYGDSAPLIGVVDPGQGGPATLTGRSLNTLSVSTGIPDFLLISEAWYPGWRAYDKGRLCPWFNPVKDNPFMAIATWETTREAWLAFYPETVVVGLFLGLLSLSVVAGIVTATAGRRRA